MSTFLDDIFGPITQDLMGDLGKAIAYTRVTAGTYDPTTGETAADSAATTAIKALVSYASPRDFPAALVMANDRKLSVAGADMDPEPTGGDQFVVDGQTYTVPAEGGVMPTYSGEDVALYDILGRKT